MGFPSIATCIDNAVSLVFRPTASAELVGMGGDIFLGVVFLVQLFLRGLSGFRKFLVTHQA